MSDVLVLTPDSQIQLEIDCTGCLNEETLSIETLNKINESVATHGTEEDSLYNGDDYFKLFGLEKPKASDAGEREFQKKLKINFREMIRKYHPDLNPDPTGENESITKQCILGYDILSDKY